MEAQRVRSNLFKMSHCCAKPKSHKNIPKKCLAGTKWGVVAVSLVDASGWVRHNFGCACGAGLPKGCLVCITTTPKMWCLVLPIGTMKAAAHA